MIGKWLVSISFFALGALGALACSDSAGARASDAGPSGDGAVDPNAFNQGVELKVPLPAAGARVYVKLDPPSIVDLTTISADPKTSNAWDLAFDGVDVFTNSGISGAGNAAAFGPLDAVTFLGDTAPSVPFLTQDKAGGAFLDWYKYEGSPSHALWSRYHVFGVKDGDRLWKVQILGYYGERDGAATAGLYRMRWAELPASGPAGAVQEAANLDGTAGGPTAPPTAKSECLDLGTSVKTQLTPAESLLSEEWHLCFRRQTISVNGEIGGPRGVTAVDLEADKSAAETIGAVKALTAESQLAAFDAITAANFTGKAFRGDRVVSGFTDVWIDSKKTPLTPVYGTWIAVEAGGQKKFLIGFPSFENATATSPGTVVMRIKPVKG